MKTCKEKTLELLSEVKKICIANDIEYFISGELALYEYKERKCKSNFNNGAIAIFAKDIEKFCSIVESRQDRLLESLKNNRNFPGFYLRYMDPSTTLLNYAEPAYTYQTNSMGIDIEIICGKSNHSLKHKVLNYIKKAWVIVNKPHQLRGKKSKKRIAVGLANAMFSVIRHTSLMQTLFDVWVDMGKAQSSHYEIATNRGTIGTFEKDIVFNTEETRYWRRQFKIVTRLDEFIEGYYRNYKTYKKRRYDIYTFDIPWSQFSQVIDREQISIQRQQKRQAKYLRWRKIKYLPMARKRLKYYSYMFCSEDRMLFYKEYDEERKQMILKLFENREYEQLRIELEEYISKIKHYALHQIGFCFDSDIFRIAICVMLDEEADESKNLDSFEKRAISLLELIDSTDYRHFDSVYNVFFGEREEAQVLIKRKKEVLDVVETFYRERLSKAKEEMES